jgi:thiamine pyrophosphate-dependent acetolactate synthase large subunit-like protein
MTMTTPPAVATEPSAADAVDRAIGLLARAERPLIVLGQGSASAEADDQIRAFVECTGIPYLPMSMARRPLMTALASRARPGQIAAPAAWRAELDARKERNARGQDIDLPLPPRRLSAGPWGIADAG